MVDAAVAMVIDKMNEISSMKILKIIPKHALLFSYV